MPFWGYNCPVERFYYNNRIYISKWGFRRSTGQFEGLSRVLHFLGVPLGVLGASLGDVRAGGGFWVAGAGFRRSGARSGVLWGSLGLGVLAPRAALGSGGAFWGRGRGSNRQPKTERGRGVRFWVVCSGGAPLGLGLRAENITEGAQVVSAPIVAICIAAAGSVETEDVVSEPLHLGGSIGLVDAGMFCLFCVLGRVLGRVLGSGFHGISSISRPLWARFSGLWLGVPRAPVGAAGSGALKSGRKKSCLGGRYPAHVAQYVEPLGGWGTRDGRDIAYCGDKFINDLEKSFLVNLGRLID